LPFKSSNCVSMIPFWFFAAGVGLLALHSTSHACYLLPVEFPEAILLLKWVSAVVYLFLVGFYIEERK